MSTFLLQKKFLCAVNAIKKQLEFEKDLLYNKDGSEILKKRMQLYIQYSIIANSLSLSAKLVSHFETHCSLKELVELILSRILQLKEILIANLDHDNYQTLLCNVLLELGVIPEDTEIKVFSDVLSNSGNNYGNALDELSNQSVANTRKSTEKYSSDDHEGKRFRILHLKKKIPSNYYHSELSIDEAAAIYIQRVWRVYYWKKNLRTTLEWHMEPWLLEKYNLTNESKQKIENANLKRTLLKDDFAKEFQKKYFLYAATKAEEYSQLERKFFFEGMDELLRYRRQVGVFPQHLTYQQSKDFSTITTRENMDVFSSTKSSEKSDKSELDLKLIKKLEFLCDAFEAHLNEFSKTFFSTENNDCRFRKYLKFKLSEEARDSACVHLEEELAFMRVLMDFNKEKRVRKKNQVKKKKTPDNNLEAGNEKENIDSADLQKFKVIVNHRSESLSDLAHDIPYFDPRLGRNIGTFSYEYQLRQLLVERFIIPLISLKIRNNIKKPSRSLLIHGPPASGKEFLMRIIANEANATIFEMSPEIFEKWSIEKNIDLTTLIQYIFFCARRKVPSIIYIQNVEKLFSKAHGKLCKAKQQEEAQTLRIMKDHLFQFLKEKSYRRRDDRILIVGCTSRPFDKEVNQKALSVFFDDKILIGVPSFSERRETWRRCIASKGIKFDFNLVPLVSALAEISEGFSSNSIKIVVDEVFRESKVGQPPRCPLSVDEFLKPLAKMPCCFPEEWEHFKNFHCSS